VWPAAGSLLILWILSTATATETAVTAAVLGVATVVYVVTRGVRSI
jgi:hypothetical protein